MQSRWLTRRRSRLAAAGFAALAVAALAAPGAFANEHVWVAPNGSDAAPGTKAQPFQTLERAQQEVRTMTATMSSNIVVHLRGGTYQLDEPLQLSDAGGDSGENGHKVVWKAHKYGKVGQEDVVVSGGRTITGWTEGVGDVWSAEVGDLDTRQLYIDGVRATRATLGAGIPGNVETTATGYVTDSLAPQSWENPEDIEFVYHAESWETLGGLPFSEPHCGVADITGDGTSTTITMDQPCFDWGQELFGGSFGEFSYPWMLPTDTHNSKTFLTEPGTFYLDRSVENDHVLYYIPRVGEDMETADVVAPALETIVEGEGTLADPLHDVQFKGLTFAHATWLAPNLGTGFIHFVAIHYYNGGDVDPSNGDYPQGEEVLSVPGSVLFHGAERIVFEGNRFEKMGASGLEISSDGSDNTIRGNVFTDLSGAGLQVGPVGPFTTGTYADNTISNNWIHDVGVEFPGSVGVHLSMNQNSTVKHNQVNDVPYTAIFLGGDFGDVTQGQHAIANRVFDAMNVLGDGGGIYATSPQGSVGTRSIIKGNVVSDLFRDPSIGIYTDFGAAWVTAKDNVVYDTPYVFGGCSAPTIHDVLIKDSFVDHDTQIWEVCGPLGDNVVVSDLTILGTTDPEGACDAILACEAIVDEAGLKPEWEWLLGT